MDKEAILIEVVYAFAKHTACDGCKLEKQGVEELKQIFKKTVGDTSGMPDRWEADGGKAREFVLKRVEEIGKGACKEAKLNNNGVLSKKILHDAADEVISAWKKKCNAEDNKNKPIRLQGVFCDTW